MEKLKSKKKLIIVVVSVVVILLLGASFAFFTFFKPVEAFVLSMNGVPMQVEFKEGTNVIDNPYAYPISDEFAKENLGKLGYVDFTVSGGTPSKEYLYYELYLTEENGNTLDSQFIKVYLTDTTDTQVVEPSIYNSLSKTTSDNSTGKILYSETLTGIFEKTYRLYVWIDKDYSQNTEHQTFAFKVNLYAKNAPVPAVETLKEKLGTDGLVGVTSNNEKVETADGGDIREYRYSGQAVNNYVYFNCNDTINDYTEQNGDNCETWRILGIFKDEAGQEHIKIVRDKVLEENLLPDTYEASGKTFQIKESGTNAYWDYDGSNSDNNWSDAGLMNWLNSTGTTDGYLKTLTSTAQGMIENAKWYLGTLSYDSGIKITPAQAYEQERDIKSCNGNIGSNVEESGCRVWVNNAAIWTGKIGLMYPSDYTFSADSSNWTTTVLNDYSETSKDTSWLQIGANHTYHEWFLSPSSGYSGYVTGWYSDGYVYGDNAVYFNGVRPSLYLQSQIGIVDGNGTSDEPYKLG